MSSSLHTRFPCSSPTPRACSNYVHWVGDAIQPSHPLVVPFSSCLQFSPASGSFQMSHFFTSGGLTIGVFNFSISPSNEYSGLITFRMDWLDLLTVQGTLKTLNTAVQKHQFFSAQLFYSPTLTSIHDYWKNYRDILSSKLYFGSCLQYLMELITEKYMAN